MHLRRGSEAGWQGQGVRARIKASPPHFAAHASQARPVLWGGKRGNPGEALQVGLRRPLHNFVRATLYTTGLPQGSHYWPDLKGVLSPSILSRASSAQSSHSVVAVVAWSGLVCTIEAKWHCSRLCITCDCFPKSAKWKSCLRLKSCNVL